MATSHLPSQLVQSVLRWGLGRGPSPQTLPPRYRSQQDPVRSLRSPVLAVAPAKKLPPSEGPAAALALFLTGKSAPILSSQEVYPKARTDCLKLKEWSPPGLSVL